MVHMVVGFAFDRQSHSVLLIRKLRPPWQAGRLNGVGGKCEANEVARDAMTREFREETGVDIPCQKWRRFCKLTASDGQWRVHFFSTEVAGIVPRQVEDEQPVWVPYSDLPAKVIDNLRWLIPMALAESSVDADVVEVTTSLV